VTGVRADGRCADRTAPARCAGAPPQPLVQAPVYGSVQMAPFWHPPEQTGVLQVGWLQSPLQVHVSRSVQTPPIRQGRAQVGTSRAGPLTPSRQVTQRASTHEPESQSYAPSAQAAPRPQGSQVSPPQSTSDSSPFLAPSSQVDVHTSPFQRAPSEQSLSSTQKVGSSTRW
jgi:hypothetical protein